MAGDIHAFVSENAAFDLVVADERIAWLDAEIRRLEEWLVEVLVEAQSYRCLAQAAIHALHRLTRDNHTLRQHHHELRDEYRGLRQRLLRDAGARP
jgi:hypothetical protein